MEDLNFCIEFVENSVRFLTTPGQPMFEYYAALFWAQQPLIVPMPIMPMPLALLKTLTLHSFSKKDLVFWNCVIKLMAQYIGKEIKAMLPAWLGTHFFELLVEIFSWVVATFVTLDADLCKIETSRDPPKIFIPIPKIESNGCARSDSLICSLIF
ncbi:hypothetical protein QUA62_28455 [Microcoleus sp. MON1_C1]|uniref:hypothetical protein n=1 Tax=Microcoleus sp. MON1_C1 TaxID=2818827 RepID=UPI002FCF595D